MSINKWSVKREKSIQEVAGMLRDIADQIETDKKINVDERIIMLPKSVGTKIKHKLKDGRSKFSIKLYWQESEPLGSPNVAIDIRPSRTATVPKKFKEMKKLMDDSLDDLETSLRKKGTIDIRNAEIFKSTVNDFKTRANPEWQGGLDELENLTCKMLDTLENNEISNTISDIRQIWDLKERYHKIFK